MMTRRTLADAIDDLDEKIAELNREKVEFYAAYRGQVEKSGANKDHIKLELAAVKVAIRQRQKLAKDPDAVAEKDDLVDSIVVEITRPAKNNAPAATPAPAKGNPDAISRTRASAPMLDAGDPPDFLRRTGTQAA